MHNKATTVAPQDTGRMVARADRRIYVLVGILMGSGLALSFAVGMKQPADWRMFSVVSIATVASFCCLRWLRLEIGPDGIQYRNLSTNRSLRFCDIERAYFATVHSGHVPQGVATFWVQPKVGRPMKINLRTFPIDAAATLFTQLDLRGIAINVPNTWSAKRMAAEIRRRQAKQNENNM